jgi:hypothetical protein
VPRGQRDGSLGRILGFLDLTALCTGHRRTATPRDEVRTLR